jgi:hypothetical protein
MRDHDHRGNIESIERNHKMKYIKTKTLFKRGWRLLHNGDMIKLGDMVEVDSHNGLCTESGNMGLRVGDDQSQYRYMRKGKKSKTKTIAAKITEKRILQLSNDLSENIATGTTQEWRAVAKYFRDQFDDLHIKFMTARDAITLWAQFTHQLNRIAAELSLDEKTLAKRPRSR